MNDIAAPPAPDMELRVKQYVQLRDKKREMKKRHEEEMKPYDEAMDMIEQLIINWLQSIKANNIATDEGTAYITTRVSATVKDASAFWDFVRENELFDLIDKRANAPAVTAYIEANGQPPPGINYNTMLILGVRRAS